MPSIHDILAADRAHVWPPYTSPDAHEANPPLVVEAAEGIYLHTADGRALIDGNGSWWVNTLGHRHPRLVRALTEQAQVLAHCSYGGITHEPAALLAKELVEVAPPGLTRVHFSDDGSTAVEVAIKIAVQYWAQNGRPKRTKFVALGGAYHGDTIGAVSVGALEAFQGAYRSLCFEVVRPDAASDARGFERAVETIEKALAREGDAIAAVVVEPLLQGAAGMQIWSEELLVRLREATKRADTFLVADEVFTGYGRTGRMWACDRAGVTPDLLCTSKAFSGGMLPMAATLATDRVYDGFRGDASRALMHGHSYFGNPLGSAVAREVLAVYRDEKIVEGVERKAARVRQAFERMAELPLVRRVRTLGLVGAADLGPGGGYRGMAGWDVYAEALARGAYLRPLGDTVYIAPPLTITEMELDHLLEILNESIAAAGNAARPG